MTNIEEAVKRLNDHVTNIDETEMSEDFSVFVDDLRTLLAGIEAAKAEIDECNAHIKACAEENERLRDALSTVHNDLLENDDPHGKLVLSQSAWTLMIEALKGGA